MNILKNNKLWLFLIILYPLLFIWQGFDMTDIGFSLTYYNDFFVKNVSHGYALWLTNFIGALWNGFFGSLGYIGFKIAFVILVYGNLFISYLILKDINKKIIFFALFLTEIFIIKNGGYWINYNILSSLFYSLIVLFIYSGYKNEKQIYFLLAGIFAGINIFIRFPNILDFLFVIIIIYIDLLYFKRNLFKDVLNFIFGFLFGIFFILILLYFKGEIGLYIDGIKNLFIHSDKTHSGSSLLYLLIKDHVLALSITFFFLLFIKYFTIFISKFNFKIQWISIIILSVISIYILKIFTLWKYLYVGLFYIAVLYIFFNSKKLYIKIVALLSFFYIFLIPLGSNNGIFNARFGMWIIMPFIIIYFSNIEEIKVNKNVLYHKNMFKYFKRLFVVVTLVFSIVTKYHYTYRDSTNRFAMIYPIHFHKLKYIYTTKKRAKIVEEFLINLQKYIKNRALFTYEKTAILYYLFNKVSYLSHPWAVDYMEPKIFKKEFLKFAYEKFPIIAISKYSVSTFNWPYDKKPLTNKHNAELNRQLVKQFMNKNNYKLVWENEYFEIWDKTSK